MKSLGLSAAEMTKRRHAQSMAAAKRSGYAYVKLMRSRNGEWLDDYKTMQGCSICGERRLPCLDFHHVGDKTKGVGVMRHGTWSLARLKSEVDKCIVVCANCHRMIHAEQMKKGWK
jgi:hypothetical protein